MLPVGGGTMRAVARKPWIWALVAGTATLLAWAGPAAGDEYWIRPLTHPVECKQEVTSVVMINTDAGGHDVLLERADGWTKTVAVPGESFAVEDLACPPQGHRIDAPPEVEVQFAVNRGGGSKPDTGAMLDHGSLGTTHRVMGADEEKLFLVATHNGTTVTIVPTRDGIPLGGVGPALTAGAPTSFAMDRADHAAYSFSNPDPDPTGTWVLSDHPVAVYASGGSAPGPPSTTGTSDRMASPVYPLGFAGTEYVVCASSEHRPDGTIEDTVRIVPAAPGITHVDFDPVPTGLPAGGIDIDAATTDWFEFQVLKDTVLTSDRPILVGQYVDASTYIGGDPAGEMLIPTDRFRLDAAIVTGPAYQGQTATWSHQVVQVATPIGSDVAVNGVAVTDWRTVGASGYRCGSQDLSLPDQPYFVKADQPSMFVGHGYSMSGLTDIGYMHLLYSGCLPAVPPDAPTGLSASAAGGAVSLAWTPSGDDGGCPITEQRVYRQTAGLPWTQILSLPATDAAAADTVPVACDPYQYHVTAVSQIGESVPSNTASVYHRLPPGAPTGLAVFAHDGDRWTLAWDPPAADGGCPVRAYVLYSGGAVLGTSLEAHFQVVVAPCASRTVQVSAVTEVGEGPLSGPFTIPAVGGLACVPPADPRAPESSDADGDGLPDAHDACPAVAGPGGCAGGPVAPAGGAAGPCSIRDVLPLHARASWTPGSEASPLGDRVLVTWDAPETCALDRFLVWNGTGHDLIAVVPFEATGQPHLAWDEDPWPAAHRYFVQAEAGPGPDVFHADRAVPTGLVRAPACLDCVTDPAPEDPAVVAGLPQASASGPDGAVAATWLWILVALVLVGALWRLLRSGPLWRLFTRLDRDGLEEHPLRSQILELVRGEPGIHTAGLADRLERSTGAVRHHLRLLTAAGLLRKERLDGRSGYFEAGVAPAVRRAALASRSGSARRVLAAVSAAPGSNLSDLASRLGLSHTAVTHHVRALQRAGLVAVERAAGEIQVRLEGPGGQAPRSSG